VEWLLYVVEMWRGFCMLSRCGVATVCCRDVAWLLYVVEMWRGYCMLRCGVAKLSVRLPTAMMFLGLNLVRLGGLFC